MADPQSELGRFAWRGYCGIRKGCGVNFSPQRGGERHRRHERERNRFAFGGTAMSRGRTSLRGILALQAQSFAEG